PGSAWSRPVGPARAESRPGLEEFLVRKGRRFFFVDTHRVAGGAPIGTYDDRGADSRLDAARDGTGLSPNEPNEPTAARRRASPNGARCSWWVRGSEVAGRGALQARRTGRGGIRLELSRRGSSGLHDPPPGRLVGPGRS